MPTPVQHRADDLGRRDRELPAPAATSVSDDERATSTVMHERDATGPRPDAATCGSGGRRGGRRSVRVAGSRHEASVGRVERAGQRVEHVGGARAEAQDLGSRSCRRCGGAAPAGVSATAGMRSSRPSTPPTDSRPFVIIRITSGCACDERLGGDRPHALPADLAGDVDAAERVDQGVGARTPRRRCSRRPALPRT